MPSSIRSLFVVGNSYSATTQATAYQAWPGMLSSLLGFSFVQANNVAVPGAQLKTLTTPPKPGLLDQLQRLPGGSKIGALLVIWLFPPLDDPTPASYIPIYDTGIDVAYSKRFRMVLMPNLPDVTKTPFYKANRSRVELAALHNLFASFNAQYNTMIGTFRTKHPDVKFATVNMFVLWDGQGVVADGFHPNVASHTLFAGWFYNAISNF
jgi:hypothetical protein